MYKVVIVDDDMWARADIRATFESLSGDFEVVAEFENAESALWWMYSNQVDMVLTDICMNRQSGLDMIRVAKANGVRAIWVIISGYDDFAFIQEAFRNQVFYYMLKPIQNEDLKSVLDRASVQLSKEADSQRIPEPETKNNQDVLGMLVSYIQEHYAEDITLEELAQMFHIDNSYLSHLFVKKMGMNFSYYRNSIRIHHSKELLLSTQKGISEIALEVGYANVSYFNRVFKDIVGVTPMKYRSQ